MLNNQVTRALFLVAAVILFAIAYSFGGSRPYEQVTGPPGSVAANVAMASNNVAGLASFGFAVAGGLSLLSAAILTPKS